MLDHALLDTIAGLRRALDDAMLDRRGVDERLQVDVLLGDLTWETTYSLPGEGDTPRVRADVTLEWPTWSQTALRAWRLGDEPDELPEVLVELVLQVQDLAAAPEPATIARALPSRAPSIGETPFEREPMTVEHRYDDAMHPAGFAIEIVFTGTYVFSDVALADSSVVAQAFAPLGGWLASALVRIGDLPLEYLPAPGEAGR